MMQYKASFFLSTIGQFLVSFNVFLGVYSGEPVQQCAPFDLGDMTIIRRNSYGLGNVWYSDLIPEILNNNIKL